MITALLCLLLGHRPITFLSPVTHAPTDMCSRCWRGVGGAW